jgi:hypothetical protein
VQRPADVAGAPLPVEVAGDPFGIGVDLDDRVQPRPAAVDRLDPVEVLLHQLA